MPDEQGALVAEPGEGALNWPALGALREGLDPRDATDALYALGGTDLYRSLVRERGWTPDRYERWLFELGCRELLGIEPDGP